MVQACKVFIMECESFTGLLANTICLYKVVTTFRTYQFGIDKAQGKDYIKVPAYEITLKTTI